MKVFILGATGLIGRRLVEALVARGDEVTALSRSAVRANQLFGPRVRVVEGDPGREGPWMAQLEDHDAVVNLTGEPIADRAWTDARKMVLRASRVEVTRNLVKGLEAASHRPRVLVNASGIDYYGDQGDRELTEELPPGTGFLAEVCRDWEEAAAQGEGLGVRVVRLRTGVVLDLEGGALASMVTPFKLFAGGPIGPGGQWFPWIHHADLVGLILFSLDHDPVSGAVNAVAPQARTMAQFSATLGRVLKRPSWLKVPAFALRIGLGERADMLLASHRVIPAKLTAAGFRFRFPELEPALRDVLRR